MRVMRKALAATGALLFVFLWTVVSQTPTTESGCELADAVKAELRVSENGTWHVTEELYGEHGIQKIVDCAEEGDVISLDPSLTIRPSSRIIIRRDVTILGGQRLDGRPPTKRTVFTCPPGQGLFLLKCVSTARHSLHRRHMDCRSGFSLINVVIKDCHLTEKHKVAAIIKADACRRPSSVWRKVHLSDVLFESNANLGGSVGLVVRDPPCHGEVELLDVAFKDNLYLDPSVLAKENTLTNVQVVANGRFTNSDFATDFFHFPKNSSSTVTNLTATDNASATVLYVERGKLNVSSSLFQNNTGKWNAVVRALSSSLTMHDTRFLNNSCSCSYVAVTAEDESSVHFSSCTFARNFGGARSFGLILAPTHRGIGFSSCDFIENVVRSTSGKTVDLGYENRRQAQLEERESASIEFTRCRFLRNKMSISAAVYLTEFNGQTVLFDSCEVRNNTTPDGQASVSKTPGAIRLKNCYVQNFTTRNCTFESNSDIPHLMWFSTVYGTFWIRNTTFSDNRTPSDQPASVLKVERKDKGSESTLAQNASDSEAILKLEDSELRGNGGPYTGSTLHVADEQMQVELRDSRFLDNRAVKGGAVFVEHARSLDVEGCTFVRNTATGVGGAMCIERGQADIRKCTFVENTGENGGAIDTLTSIVVQDSEFRGNRARVRGGAMNIDCPESVSRTPLLLRSTFRRNRANRSGGALHLYASSRLTMERCRFVENHAEFGGGVSLFRVRNSTKWFVLKSHFSRNSAETGGAISMMESAEAQATNRSQDDVEEPYYFSDTVIVHNTATLSGAGIFAEDPSLLSIEETPANTLEKAFDCQTMERPPSNAFGENFRNNIVARGYEENLASLPVGFCVSAFIGGRLAETISENSKYVLPRWRSGDGFPVLRVVMYDQFGNNFSRTRNEDFLERTPGNEPENAYHQPVHVILSSKTENAKDESMDRRFLRNSIYEDVSSGSGNISVGNPYVKPEQYQLTLLVEGFEQRNVTVEVQVRDCTINEESGRGDTFCGPCDSNQYNFHSADTGGKCALCPENADCATAFIFPRMGYWNAFPCSNQMERCAYEEACNFTRPNMLEGVTDPETPCVFSDDVIELYQSSQCAAEYEGPLCGSCLDGAGRLGSFVCTPCMSELLAVVGQFGVLVLQLILALLPMRETLNIERDHLQDRMTTLSFMRRTRRSIRSPGSYRSFRGGPISRSRRSAGVQAGTSRNSTACKVSRAKRRFLGTLKITINLLQTVAIAASLDVSWNSTTISFFRTWDTMGVAASVGASLFLDCLLSNGTGAPRTVKRQIIVALLPELVALVISAFFLLRELKGDKDWNRLIRRVILAHIVVVYNSYLVLVKIAVDAFNCVRVHDGIRLEDIDATHRYWISDTSVECFTGSHLAFTLAVSVPLLLFAVLFPVLLAVLLERARRQHKLSSKWTQETMGFLFIVFEEEYVYWDSVILLRKAVLSVIIVSAYKLGGNLQGLLVAAVLVIALFVQMYFNPFSRDLGDLNVLESVSLLVSFFTFLCGLVLNSKRSDGVLLEGLLTAVLLGSNILLFLTLVFTLARIKLEQFRLELEVMQVDGSDGAFYVVIWSYLAYQLARLRGRIEQPDSVDHEAETEPQRSVELSGV